MMPRVSPVFALLFALVLSAPAAAQIKGQDVRLFVDGALFSWDKRLESLSEPASLEGGYHDELKTMTSGPLSEGGVGAGLAISPHLIPQVYLSLQNLKVQFEDEPTKLRKFELRPALDVALLWSPDLRARALRFAPSDPDRGAVGATLGYPGGGGLAVVPAAVTGAYRATGRDIYGEARVVVAGGAAELFL